MTPFDTANQAIAWITAHAQGSVEVYVFTSRFILGGIWSDTGWMFE